MQVRFGITFLPNAPREFVDWARTAEATGFDIVGIADSQSLYSAGSHLSRFTTEGKWIPPELMGKVRELGARYQVDQHDKPDSANRRLVAELGLVDYLADHFSVAGTPDDCVRKLEQAIEAGAHQFWMSVHFDDKARFMHDWSTRVMPAFH